MSSYPDIIPVFPLSGVIYFPKTNLPLNIFEQRYLNLVNDAYKKDKLMEWSSQRMKIIPFIRLAALVKLVIIKRSKDGRILVNLTGVTRFEILNEVVNNKLYREFKVNYKIFEEDLSKKESKIESSNLMEKTKVFFKKNGLLLNWSEFEKLDQVQKINTLAMISPITIEEKQKLLETISLKEKATTLENIINFYLHEVNFNNLTVQ